MQPACCVYNMWQGRRVPLLQCIEGCGGCEAGVCCKATHRREGGVPLAVMISYVVWTWVPSWPCGALVQSNSRLCVVFDSGPHLYTSITLVRCLSACVLGMGWTGLGCVRYWELPSEAFAALRLEHLARQCVHYHVSVPYHLCLHQVVFVSLMYHLHFGCGHVGAGTCV